MNKYITNKTAQDLSYILAFRINGDLCPGSIKAKFKSQSKKFLKELARELGLMPSQYTLRFDPAGPAVSGEAALHSDSIYVQISQSGDFNFGDILYRKCNNIKDYSSLDFHNCFCYVSDFLDIVKKDAIINKMKGLL